MNGLFAVSEAMLSSVGFRQRLRHIGCVLLVGILSSLSARGEFAALKTLHQFPGDRHGSWSYCSPLTLASDGSFYGAASTNSDVDNAGMYRIEKSGAFKVLSDPERTFESLVSGSDGTLYGFDTSSGNIFRIAPGGEVSIITTITHDSDWPVSPLRVDDDGALYWTSLLRDGSIHRLSPNGQLTNLFEFSGQDGRWPSTLAVGRDGYLYGIAEWGGRKSGGGVIFRLSKTGDFKILHEFDNEAGAQSSLLYAKDGFLYGTRAVRGAWGLGFLFRIDPKSRKYTVVHNFRGGDGANPLGALTEGRDGYIYGTTSIGGPGGHGVVYRFGSSGGIQLVYAFSGLDGSSPVGGLVKKGNAFFGVTRHGGTSQPEDSQGTIFQLVVPRELSEIGCWDGLLRTDSPESGIVGNAIVSITARDTFSIVVRCGRDRIACFGRFDANGRYTRQRVPGQKSSYAVELRKYWTGRVQGRVSDGATSATFNLVPGVPGASFSPWRCASLKVNCLLLPKAPAEYGALGFMRMRGGNRNGRIIAVGILPNGTPFSTGAAVGLGLQIGLYAPLFDKHRGLVAGTLEHLPLAEGYFPLNPQFPGGLTWIRPGHEQPEIKFNAFYSY